VPRPSRSARPGRGIPRRVPPLAGLSLVALKLAASALGAQSRVAILTDDDLVPAPLADPRVPRFAVFQTWSAHATLPSLLAVTSFGGEIGLVRWTRAGGAAIQLGAAGGMSATFDMGSRSNDLMNEDYVGGFPLALRRGGIGVRLTPYHVSSHLGDEFAERSTRPRSHVTYEGLDVLVALDGAGGRIYAGGVLRESGERGDLRRRGGHLGAELRRPAGRRRDADGRVGASWIAALDAQSGALRGAPVAWSARAGLELAEPAAAGHRRRIALLASAYAGPAPFQQFAAEYVRGVGVGLVVSP
jgi:hypothetical protein